jgi:hypothetical protein
MEISQYVVIQDDSQRKIDILGGGSTGYCEKKAHINVCLILNGYPDRAICNSRPDSVIFLFVGLDVERSLKKER